MRKKSKGGRKVGREGGNGGKGRDAGSRGQALSTHHKGWVEVPVSKTFQFPHVIDVEINLFVLYLQCI